MYLCVLFMEMYSYKLNAIGWHGNLLLLSLMVSIFHFTLAFMPTTPLKIKGVKNLIPLVGINKFIYLFIFVELPQKINDFIFWCGRLTWKWWQFWGGFFGTTDCGVKNILKGEILDNFFACFLFNMDLTAKKQQENPKNNIKI